MKKKSEEQKLHKRIMDAFNSVPTYKGFTTKDLAVKLDMPESPKLHLERIILKGEKKE